MMMNGYLFYEESFILFGKLAFVSAKVERRQNEKAQPIKFLRKFFEIRK